MEMENFADNFLPICREDMENRGWDAVDFVYVIGDAYVDHHSFGPAVISRTLEAAGYRVGIISQPDWKDDESIKTFGKPRLSFLVSAGNMDSMVNHYTSAKKRRHEDSYTPSGVIGKRPDRACIVYGNLIRRVYGNVPVILGGIEASLRRLGHYDYWSDKVRRSILVDSGADLISYGMGEKSIVELADALDAGIAVSDITYIRGTVYRAKELTHLTEKYERLPDFSEIESPDEASKRRYADSFLLQYQNTDPFTAKILVEKYGKNEYVIQNPPAEPLSQEEMDRVYEYPYQRTYHPSYEALGGVPAIKELKFSLTSCRGCFGACNFCALTFHQGRIIQSRSHESILREVKIMRKDKEFKGYINDVGGPTADFRHPSCKEQLKRGTCKNRQCLGQDPCKNVIADHRDYLSLLRKLRALKGVKKVFIRSGIRFDYVLLDKDPAFLKELCEYHVSGQLKVAPEHVSDPVLRQMGKPGNKVYEEFRRRYFKMNERLGKKQYLVPYLMSSHPGSDMKEAVKLAEYVRDLGYMPEQVQDFYPTPSTLSTCMYYTGYNPVTKETVYVPKTEHEKKLQRALIQYRNPKNRPLILEALKLAGREDLVGNDKKCLIRAENVAMIGNSGKKNNRRPSLDGEKRISQKKKTIRNVHKKR